jgi:hypothetical protein
MTLPRNGGGAVSRLPAQGQQVCCVSLMNMVEKIVAAEAAKRRRR